MIIEFNEQQVEYSPWYPSLGRIFTTTYAFDCETTEIDQVHRWRTPLYVLGAATDGQQGCFVLPEHLAEFFRAHFDVPVVMHNAPFDLSVIDKVVKDSLDIYKLVEKDLVWDTQLLHRLLVLALEGHTARGKGQATLDRCCERYLGVELPKALVDAEDDKVRMSYAKWLDCDPAEIESVYLEYPAKDVLATIAVYREVIKRLREALYARSDAFGYPWPSTQ